MTQEQLYKLIQDDASPTPSDVVRLRALAEQYPYFEIAKFIYLKAIYEYEVQSFKSELSRLGILLRNRESLFYYIFRDDYAQYFRKTGKEKLEEDKTKLLLDAFFDDQQPDSILLEYETQPNNNLATADYLSYLEKENSEKEKEENLKHRKEGIFSKLIYIENEEEEEDITPPNPIEVASPYILEEDQEEINLVPLKHQNIIDKFIENSESIKFTSTLTKESVKEDRDQDTEAAAENETNLGDDVFFTETLAKIYTKQKRYEKAYEIIEHLSLKYPKKNSYFADQLRYLEKLIINSKSKNKK